MFRGPKEKKERALGVRLGLKGERALSPKSALVRKPYRPGVHGPKSRPRAMSEFGLEIREKNKFKLMYGVNDDNLKRLFKMAEAVKGASGMKLMEFLERRLDNVVFRLGFAPSRAAARQLVVQSHIAVNGKKVRSPGFVVKIGDIVGTKGDLTGDLLKQKELLEKYDAPAWLALHPGKMEGEVLSLPTDVEVPFEINLLVESFSK
jgi:small subunit ribosomal protein S4